MFIGVVLDATNPAGCPAISDLSGITYVRLIARRDPAVYTYCKQLQQAGIKVGMVLARESFGTRLTTQAVTDRILSYVQRIQPDFWVTGNESDADLLSVPSPASWTMKASSYHRFAIRVVAALRAGYTIYYAGKTPVIIGGGLVSGQPSWLAGRDWSFLDGFDIHPYSKSASEAQQLLEAYRQYIDKLYVCEWSRPVEEIKDFQIMLNEETEANCWMCYSDGQVDGMGLLDKNGNKKPEYDALFSLIGQ